MSTNLHPAVAKIGEAVEQAQANPDDYVLARAAYDAIKSLCLGDDDPGLVLHKPVSNAVLRYYFETISDQQFEKGGVQQTMNDTANIIKSLSEDDMDMFYSGVLMETILDDLRKAGDPYDFFSALVI